MSILFHAEVFSLALLLYFRKFVRLLVHVANKLVIHGLLVLPPY